MKKIDKVVLATPRAARKPRISKALSHRTGPAAPAWQGGRNGPATLGDCGRRRDANVVLDCGWGRLLFAGTFEDDATLLAALKDEAPLSRDIAFYVGDPHVLLSRGPQEIFLDPSHTYRLDLATYRPGGRRPRGITIRRLGVEGDAGGINAVYAACGMVQVREDFFAGERDKTAPSPTSSQKTT